MYGESDFRPSPFTPREKREGFLLALQIYFDLRVKRLLDPRLSTMNRRLLLLPGRRRSRPLTLASRAVWYWLYDFRRSLLCPS